ncbi:endonuclease NucS domain-containing protein [Microbacterium sp.]|uniref:endonuclease NucS domain-containing protein n=1 Tax=Microbacterium sp. TaxID=51671 RepID=UPI00092771A1|nr:endonuclease NucS domain-containing protein [Microbacterium sp.]MBN9194237.1 DUF91 domain-containing protein [Microbacterium sp.]OJU62584.1 MAG: hypothetical protein BGO04_06035 [Microbacterium sp. 70-38]
MPNMVETRYRDFLADHLDLIEPGLTFVDAEMLLPNAQGAKGFVDLVARDNLGVLVLIEIKRSDSAARSAMHELFKYMALVRENHGLANHQFRCILLSTTWHELLVPFTELLEAAMFELEGRELLVGADGNPTSTLKVAKAQLQAAIATSPKHEIALFYSDKSREAEATRMRSVLDALGVTDYYLIHLDYVGTNDSVGPRRALYLVLGELSALQRLSIQDRLLEEWRTDWIESGEDPAEWEVDESDYMDGNNWDHEEQVFVWVNHDGTYAELEIGYPDKLRTMLDSWQRVSLSRSGRFSSELAWPDEALVSAALAEGEKHSTHFISQVSTANGTACGRMITNVSAALENVKTWRKQVPKLLQALISDEDVASISIQLFNPQDVLWGIASLVTGSNDRLPGFEIVAESNTSGVRVFSGLLTWDKETRIAADVPIEKVLPEGIWQYLMSRHYDVQWEEELRLCKLHGLRYAVYEVNVTSPQQFWRVHVEGAQFKRDELTLDEMRAESVMTFARENWQYLERMWREVFEENIFFG